MLFNILSRKTGLWVRYEVVAAYSPRARPGAAASTPVDSSELTAKLVPDRHNVLNLPARLARLRNDPWVDIGNIRQRLSDL